MCRAGRRGAPPGCAAAEETARAEVSAGACRGVAAGIQADIETAIPADIPSDVQARRALFPRGLCQPEGGFRFGADTLLLAAFAAARLKRGRALCGLDLGTGCGAAALGLLLLRPHDDLRVTGLDTGPEMIACAEQNARDLGLAGRYAPHLADVAEHRAHSLDFALCNPPFRVPGTGRACPDGNRDRARFEGPGGFAAFAACAGRCLRRGAPFFLVHLSERLPGIFADLAAAGLGPRALLPVQGRAGAAPRLSLVMAVKGGAGGLELMAPLALYGADGGLTPEAAALCPPLYANPRRPLSALP